MRQAFYIAFAVASILGLIYLISEDIILEKAFGSTCVCENSTIGFNTCAPCTPAACPTATPSNTTDPTATATCPPATCPTCAPCPPPVTTTCPTPTTKPVPSNRKYQIYNEEMHSNFERVYGEYKKRHAAMLEADKVGKPGRYVYLTPNPAGGFGNRFPSFVSGMILALLTYRSVLIRWDAENQSFGDLIDPGLELVKPGWLNFAGRTQKHLSIEDSEAAIFLKQNLTTYFENDSIIEISSNDNPIVLLYGNPLYAEWMLENFGTNPYSIVAPRLLRFSDRVMKIVNAFKEQHFGEYNIGLQVRTLLDKAGPPVFGRVARLLQQTFFPKAANRTRFFMATDKQDAQNQIKGVLGSDLSYIEPFHDRHTQEAELYAMVDVALLSECDLIIISHLSTFGGIAAGYHATTAFMVNDDGSYGALAMVEPVYWGMHHAFNLMDPNDPNQNNPIFRQQLLVQDNVKRR